MTAVLRVDAASPQPGAVQQAADVIRAGGLVAFPTETVYGLGANALSAAAVARIYAAKGRPSRNPVIVHVADAAAAAQLVAWCDTAERCAAAFWPGPLTMVLPKRAALPEAVSAGLPNVAVRAPAHPVALALLQAAALPIAAPSANRSGEVSPTSAAHVQKGLGGMIDLVLDAGPTALGIESTVLSLAGAVPTILRPGSISVEHLEAVLGTVATAPNASEDGSALLSPGMLERHYAPRATVRLFARAEPPERPEPDDGALLLQAELPVRHPVRMPDDPRAYAQRLYAEMHRLDERGCGSIWVEQVPDGAAWAGVQDRLRRAAQPP